MFSDQEVRSLPGGASRRVSQLGRPVRPHAPPPSSHPTFIRRGAPLAIKLAVATAIKDKIARAMEKCEWMETTPAQNRLSRCTSMSGGGSAAKHLLHRCLVLSVRTTANSKRHCKESLVMLRNDSIQPMEEVKLFLLRTKTISLKLSKFTKLARLLTKLRKLC